jgi:hypothetical protein
MLAPASEPEGMVEDRNRDITEQVDASVNTAGIYTLILMIFYNFFLL